MPFFACRVKKHLKYTFKSKLAPAARRRLFLSDVKVSHFHSSFFLQKVFLPLSHKNIDGGGRRKPKVIFSFSSSLVFFSHIPPTNFEAQVQKNQLEQPKIDMFCLIGLLFRTKLPPSAQVAYCFLATCSAKSVVRGEIINILEYCSERGLCRKKMADTIYISPPSPF